MGRRDRRPTDAERREGALSLDEHIRVAAAALARGLVDARGFVDALRQASDGLPLERVWVDGGRISEAQLAELRGAGGETVAVGGETMPAIGPVGAPPPRREPLAELDAWLAKASVLGFGHVPARPLASTADEPTPPAMVPPVTPTPSTPGRGTRVLRGPIPPPPTGATAAGTEADVAHEPTVATAAHTEAAPVTDAAPAAAPPTDAERGGTRPAPAGAPMPTPTPAPRPRDPAGPRVRYERRELLGIGGLGQVTACFDALLGRRVAIKVARTDRDPSAEQILEREARIVALLEHPNIMPVYDAGVQPAVGPYYVMRLVDQATLDVVLAKIARGDADALADYGLKRLLRDFVQICHAVDYAHSRGVIHCDLKPSNILLGAFGEVLVVDWGLAWSRAYPDGPRGGTPGFMAPEQLDRARAEFDARTDVFALGVILYVILARQPPFPAPIGADPTTLAPGERYRSARRPSEVAPNLAVPREIEDIAMRAIELDPDRRPASARELAAAIDEWLEGRREDERRRAQADEAAAEGDELAEHVRELEDGLHGQLAELAAQRAATPPWAPPADKQALWDVEDLCAVTDAVRVRTLQAAVSAYEQALDAWPEHAGARRGLAGLYRLELARAEAERHEHDRLWFQQLVQRYDDGAVAGATGEGRLTIEVRGDCRLTLFALHDDQRRLTPREAGPLDGRPRMLHLVPAGRYVIEGRAGDRVARWPVRIAAGGEAAVEIDAAAIAGLDDGEVLVPGGAVPLGESLELADARAPETVDVAGFVARRFPVTFAEYLAFVDDLGDDPAAASHAPRDELGAPLWRREAGGWRPRRWSSADVDPDEAGRVAAFGVTLGSAAAYAAWHAARTGRPWRLPTGDEWEKAARGADGRFYPWGDRFDATFCKMRDSRPGPPRPEPVGAFAADESPYGVRDLAGGMAEWTVVDGGDEASSGAAHSRGGAWCDPPADCRVTVRRLYRPGETSWRVGFRLVRPF